MPLNSNFIQTFDFLDRQSCSRLVVPSCLPLGDHFYSLYSGRGRHCAFFSVRIVVHDAI